MKLFNKVSKFIRSKVKKLFSHNKKSIPVKPSEKVNFVTVLIQDGYFFLCAAKDLFKSPLSMYAGSVLSHHGIELILKACWIWDKSEYSYTHNLEYIANQISFFNPDKTTQDLITKVNTFYYFRYPMGDKIQNKIQSHLDRINDNIDGIATSAGEIGSGDWEKVKELYKKIVEAMPHDLHILFEGIVKKYKRFCDI